MRIKAKIKTALIDLLHQLISQEKIHRSLTKLANQANSSIPMLVNEESPYNSPATPAEVGRDGVVFISSRFRSGSTFLWNIFRQTGAFTPYYEPFNERRWFDEGERGAKVDSTHRGVSNYWSEYDGLMGLSKFYNEDWIRHRLHMGAQEYDPAMQAYIGHLIDGAPHRPVLQFNRIDFRLGWVKANFPSAKLLHLYRNPRDQWCSFLTDKTLMNKDDVIKTYVDGFYLEMWCDDLSIHFPFLDREKTPHPYQQFYYLWKLSYLFGQHYADYSFSFEELTQYPKLTLKKMFSILGVNSPPIDKLSSLVQAPKPDKWREYADSSWFEELEAECECQLNIFFTHETDKGHCL